jgi:squalene-hopene/tetraprenyl-beta-curcumene cyclase
MKSTRESRSTEDGFRERLRAGLERATAGLLEEIGPEGHWVGELSSSALSTATALIALSMLARHGGAGGDVEDGERMAGGLRWLSLHQNLDGGWGDTIRSRSNISTTALVWAAFGACGVDTQYAQTVSHAEAWLKRACGESGESWRGSLAEAIRARYGKDRTFSVPILMACVLSGRLGESGWGEVPALPFELAALPHWLFGMLQLPVVSYALPALIAIGQVIHHYAPSSNGLIRWIRDRLRARTLRVLATLQPSNGGFLEATPLTSFVLMSLAAMGEGGGCVARLAADFLRRSVRGDGSWPIDTNLATWVSTWSVQALRWQGDRLGGERRLVLREWLLGQQYRVEHPYTHAAPGGWAWTDLPGGVPDADDTPGALVALLELGAVDERTRQAGEWGVRWLLGLQNRDGGIPTFCRGWGALPFDRSSPDLTAHALRAWSAWLPQWEGKLRAAVEAAIGRGLAYLEEAQEPEGGWVPLWFGNERNGSEVNPTYGTARVLGALKELRARGFEVSETMLRRAERRLIGLQLPDGGWGGGSEVAMVSSVEETGLAVEALAGSAHVDAVRRGAVWLLERVEREAWRDPAPIGFYFAKLWYFERLYPMILSVAGLGAVQRFEQFEQEG